MNSERELDNQGNAIGLFRSAFQTAVGHLQETHQNLQDVSQEELLAATAEQRANRAWYFENDGVTQHDLDLFDDVMRDYWVSLLDCLKDPRADTTVDACLNLLFR